MNLIIVKINYIISIPNKIIIFTQSTS